MVPLFVMFANVLPEGPVIVRSKFKKNVEPLSTCKFSGPLKAVVEVV